MTHCHGYKYFFLLEKKNEATFKRKHFSFAVEKSLDRKFGSVTDKYIFRLRFITGNRVSVRSDAESSSLLCNIIMLKQIIGKFFSSFFITVMNKLN